MAKLVYAKSNQILASNSGIPAEGDTPIVKNVKELKEYKLIYEAEGSKEGARVILGSKTGIPTDSDDTIYKAETEADDETGTTTPTNVEPETPAAEEPVVEDEPTEGEE